LKLPDKDKTGRIYSPPAGVWTGCVNGFISVFVDFKNENYFSVKMPLYVPNGTRHCPGCHAGRRERVFREIDPVSGI